MSSRRTSLYSVPLAFSDPIYKAVQENEKVTLCYGLLSGVEISGRNEVGALA
jgi:hypothetical protein